MASEFFRAGVERGLQEYGVPAHLHEGLVQYVLSGVEPGGFVTCCLENNFAEAMVRAGGDLSIDDLRAIAKWLFNECPRRAWGSAGVVKTWRGQ